MILQAGPGGPYSILDVNLSEHSAQAVGDQWIRSPVNAPSTSPGLRPCYLYEPSLRSFLYEPSLHSFADA